LFEESFKVILAGAAVLFLLGLRIQDDSAETPSAAPVPATEKPSTPAEPPPTASAPVVAPTQPPAAREPEPFVLFDQIVYVTQGEAYSYGVNVKMPAEIQVVAEIDSKSPIELRIYEGLISATAYAISQDREMQTIGRALDKLAGAEQPESPKPVLTYIKEGAYRHFETDWIAVKPGEYSVIVDNTGSNSTPSRGDAPVRLQVLVR
jgi:hypothetical protein